MQKLIRFMALCCTVLLYAAPAGAQVANITRVEYYVDKDPGYGKATAITITAATALNNVSININPASYTGGVHLVGVRALNANGKWGLDNKWLFVKPFASDSATPAATNITRVEYYVDTDPGYGKATAVSITAGTSLSNIAINLNPASFINGVHLLGVRALNANGKWGLDNKWLFVKPYPEDTVKKTVSPVTQLEYYIDKDPGYGKGTPVIIDTGTFSLSAVNIAINISGLTVASHNLFVRAGNANGNWGLATKYAFKVGTAIAAPSIAINRLIRRASYCAKDTLAFSYDVAGTFNAGNVFTVQLGDSSGNFSNPVTAGTFTATNDSIVKIPLAANIAEGRYRVRIISSSPAITGITGTDTLLIHSTPAAVTITGDSAVNIAVANPYSVPSTAGYTWSWTATNATPVASANTANITWAAVGPQTIKLNAVNQYGCKGDTSVKTVMVYPYRIDSLIFSTATPCSGDSIAVTAKVTGAYKAGNIFTVQLSDSAGNFTNPVKIGSLAATPAGNLVAVTIKAGLPYALLNGAHYRIRVTGSNPADTSVATASAYLLVQKPAVGKDSVITVCAPARLNLTGIYKTTGLTTTWSTTRPDSVTATGNYRLIVTNTYGCRDTALVVVTVNPKPNLGKDTSITTTGSNVNLTTVYNTAGLTANWSTTTPASAGAGTYTLIVSNASGCKDTAIATVKVVANVPVVISFSPATVSAGANVIIKGKYFTGAAAVTFGNVAAASFTVLSDSIINAVTGNGASGAVAVTTAAGTGSLAGFTICIPVSPSVSITANTGTGICMGVKVTFTATPVNGGAAPAYKWYKNNTNVGANSTTYTDSLLNNNDSVWCVLTSNAGCLAASTANSNVLKFTVSAKVTPSVTIKASTTTSICAGVKVTFTATPVNGGTTPAYQWYKNNLTVGTNSVSYSDSLLKNGDSVWCVLTSNASCVVANTAKSSKLKFTVSTRVTPSVTIKASTGTSICAGVKVTFTATPVNGGTTPAYKWYKNNTMVGANSVTYTDSLLKTSDSVWCVLTSNASCVAANTAKSGVLKFTVNTGVVASLTIVSGNGTVMCSPAKSTFTATPVNGGTAPTYQWYKNSTAVGANSATYQDTALNNGDSIWCVLTSNEGCLTIASVKSNVIKLAVGPPPTVSITGAACTGNYLTLNSNIKLSNITWQLNGTTIATAKDSVYYAANGVTVAGGNGQGTATSQLWNPGGIYVDGTGAIYIADNGNNRVQRWLKGAAGGTTVAGGNGAGNAPNQLYAPASVAAGPGGYLYIADVANHRVVKWAPGSAAGETVAGTGVAGSAANQLNYPQGIFIDGAGNLYIADASNHRVQKWAFNATAGVTVAGGNGAGAGANQLYNPYSVYADASGNVYVADMENNRIQKWAPGATTGITVAGGNDNGAAANQLEGPSGVYLDGAKNIFVVDAGNYRIQKWSPGAAAGITVAGGKGYGAAASQLNNPNNVFVDNAGNLYVADGGNNRVQKFAAVDSLVASLKADSAGTYTAIATSVAGCVASATYTVSKSVVPSVTVAASKTTVCANTAVTFTATPVNGGAAPVYQWKKNGVNVGINSNTYKDSVWKTGDSVTVVLTSTATCVVPALVTGKAVKITVSAKPNLGKDSAVAICAGSSANIKNMYSTTSYTSAVWNTARPDSIVAAGTYTLIVANSTGCKDTAAVKVTINAKPALGKDTTLTVCTGGAANIKNVYNTTGYTSVVWSTARPDSITVAGTYSLVVTNTSGCKDTSVVTITQTTPLVPVITKTGSTAFCLSDSLVLTTNASGNLQWYRNNTAIKLATNSRYVVKVAGVYQVKAITAGGCVAASDTVVATVTQVPKPTISLVNDTLVSSATAGNQWYQAGAAITGAKGQKYSPNDIDIYTVQVTSGACKSQMSDEFIYTANTLMKKGTTASSFSSTGKTAPTVTLYPNPATDATHLKLENFEGGVLVTITDMAGRVVWQEDKLYNNTYTIPLGKVAAGMYIVTLKNRSNVRAFKLVKAK